MDRNSIYASLDSCNGQIRLLKLHRRKHLSHPKDAIKGEISTHSLHSPPVFDALSYVWGKAEVPARSQVCLNGVGLDVADNLQAALSTLGQSNQLCEYLWVDALCIDQDNDVERSAQVALMRSIYGQARRVHVYIGPSRTNTSAALTMFRNFVTQSPLADGVQMLHQELDPTANTTAAAGTTDQSPQADTRQILRQGADSSITATTTVAPFWSDEMDAFLNDFFQDTWYDRLWVIQEAALAQNPIVHIGSQTIAFWDIIAGLTRVLMVRLNSRTNKDAVWRITRIHARFLSVFNNESRPAFWTLLGTQDCGHKEEHDNVYAVLGLLKNPVDIVPDYRKPIDVVYEDFTLACIRSDRNLDILATAGLHRWRQNTGPSWVTSWDRTPAMLFTSYTKYDASGETALKDSARWPTELAYSRKRNWLCVYARILDVVVSAIELLPNGNQLFANHRDIIKSEAKDLDAYLETVQDCVAEFIQGRSSGETDTDSIAAFWKLQFTPPVSDANLQLGKHFRAWLRSEESVSEEIKDQLVGKLKYWTGRRFFTTSTRSWAAMTTGLAEPGDMLSVIAGASTPYVLRSVPRKGPSVYQLVGHVRGQGMMQGEAVLQDETLRSGDMQHNNQLFEVITLV